MLETIIVIIYLVVVPLAFFLLYWYREKRREEKAVKARTILSPAALKNLESSLFLYRPGTGTNSELKIEKVSTFLSYGLVKTDAGLSIDKTKHRCLLLSKDEVCRNDKRKVQ